MAFYGAEIPRLKWAQHATFRSVCLASQSIFGLDIALGRKSRKVHKLSEANLECGKFKWSIIVVAWGCCDCKVEVVN